MFVNVGRFLINSGSLGMLFDVIFIPGEPKDTNNDAKTTPKTNPERQRRHREPPKAILTKLGHPSGHHFGAQIHTNCKNVVHSGFPKKTLQKERKKVAILVPLGGLRHAIRSCQCMFAKGRPFLKMENSEAQNDLQKPPCWDAFGTQIA